MMMADMVDFLQQKREKLDVHTDTYQKRGRRRTRVNLCVSSSLGVLVGFCVRKGVGMSGCLCVRVGVCVCPWVCVCVCDCVAVWLCACVVDPQLYFINPELFFRHLWTIRIEHE